MNVPKMIRLGMSVVGAVLIGFVVSIDNPTPTAWALVLVGTLFLVLAAEVG